MQQLQELHDLDMQKPLSGRWPKESERDTERGEGGSLKAGFACGSHVERKTRSAKTKIK